MIFPAVFFACSLLAQQPDSIRVHQDTMPPSAVDSTAMRKKKAKMFQQKETQVLVLPDSSQTVASAKKERFFYRFFVKKYPNPRAAALLSFVLPGAGQAYNRKWWKIPIVYGALGGMTWLALDNDKEYQRLKKNYKWLVDEDKNTNPIDAPYIYMSASQLKGYRDQFRGFTEKSYLFLGITYLLAVTDAFVDAHLSRFDISDDLSLRVVPDIQSASSGFGACFGIGIRLGFGNTHTVIPTTHTFTSP